MSAAFIFSKVSCFQYNYTTISPVLLAATFLMAEGLFFFNVTFEQTSFPLKSSDDRTIMYCVL